MTIITQAVASAINRATVEFYAAHASKGKVLPNAPLPDPDCGAANALRPTMNFFVSQLLGLASAYWWWWVVAFIAILAFGVAALKSGRKILGAIIAVVAAGLLLIIVSSAPEAFFPKMQGGC